MPLGRFAAARLIQSNRRYFIANQSVTRFEFAGRILARDLRLDNYIP